MQGVAFHQQGQTQLAKPIYEQVLAQQPQHFDALHLLGVIEYQSQHAQRAVDLITRALAVKPHEVGALSNLGLALGELGRPEEAVTRFDQALALRPDFAEAHYNRGNALMKLKRADEARASFERAIETRPAHAPSHYNLGIALYELSRFEEAVRSYERALSIRPDYAEAYSNRGDALQAMQRYEAALESYDCALTHKSDYVEALSNRGNALFHLGRPQEALSSYDRALAQSPDYAEAHSNRGHALKDLGRRDEALRSYERAIEIAPDQGDAEWNRALFKLSECHFSAGWEAFHHRKRIKDVSPIDWLEGVPVWQTGAPKGRVLVLAEQGIGDEIFLSKCLSLFAQRHGAPACVTADARLLPLLVRSFPQIRFVDRSDRNSLDPQSFDLQMALGDMAAVLSVDPSQDPHVSQPHLRAREGPLDGLGVLDHPKRRPWVGLSWRSKNPKLGAGKSMTLMQMMQAFKDLEVDWINLQYGDVSAEIEQVQSALGVRVHQIPGVDLTQDLDALLQLIAACDGVVTTSNSTAHFAGAIGKPGTVMVPFGRSKLWYWHLQDGPSIWYPSLNLVHANQLHEWDEPLLTARRWIQTQPGRA